jgi:SNF2 family DNA or RNA helicase
MLEFDLIQNQGTRLFKSLAVFRSEFRLLMTGTPLQNSFKELWNILNFIDPFKFSYALYQ